MGLQPTDYQKILSVYFNNPAAYVGLNGRPMVSTFSAGGLTNTTFDCKLLSKLVGSIRDTNVLLAWKVSFQDEMYFIPMFDDTNGYYSSTSGVSNLRSRSIPLLD